MNILAMQYIIDGGVSVLNWFIIFLTSNCQSYDINQNGLQQVPCTPSYIILLLEGYPFPTANLVRRFPYYIFLQPCLCFIFYFSNCFFIVNLPIAIFS